MDEDGGTTGIRDMLMTGAPIFNKTHPVDLSKKSDAALRQEYAHLAPPDHEKRKMWFPRESSSSDEDDNLISPYTQETQSPRQNSSGRHNTLNSDDLRTVGSFFATLESDDDEGLESPEPTKP